MATSNGFLGCSGGSEEKQREVGIKRLESHVPGACLSDRREGWMLLLLEMRRRLVEGKCKYSTYRMLRL